MRTLEFMIICVFCSENIERRLFASHIQDISLNQMREFLMCVALESGSKAAHIRNSAFGFRNILYVYGRTHLARRFR